MALPTATERRTPITGTRLEEVVFDAPGTAGTLTLSYPAATANPTRARLTVRARPDAPATVLPAEALRYAGSGSIDFQRPAGFDAGAIDQFGDEARDPRPMGPGMAAVRDVVA